MEGLPAHWLTAPLNDVAKVQSGGTPSRGVAEYWNGKIPWVKISDIDSVYVTKTDEFITEEGLKNSSARIFPKGTILLTIFATIGRVGILKIDAATNQAIAGITPLKQVEEKFFYYALIHYANKLVDQAKGVAQKNINLSILKALEIPLPPYGEQKRIVAKLDTMFGRLDQIKARLGNIPVLLKQFRQAVLTQAVTGKLTDKIFEIVRLEECLEDIAYGTSSKSEYETKGYPVLRIPNIQDGEIDDSDLKYSKLEDKEYQKLKLREGDVLIIRSNGSIEIVGQAAIVRRKNIDYAYAGYLIRLRVNENLNPDFLNYCLKSTFLRNQITEMAHSTSGVNNINSTQLKELQIPKPHLKEQIEIVKRIESLFAIADRIEASYKTLQEKIDHLPQAILAKAFRGELSNMN